MHTANINLFTGMILDELDKAETKHPKFCDVFSMKEPRVVRELLRHIRKWNDEGPYQADCILNEEILEATEAYMYNDNEHCLQELAQCGAVILRMMEFVGTEA